MSFDWRVVLSAAIGLSIAAGIVLAVEELVWLKRRGQLTRPALREMAMSLSTLPPNVVVCVVAGGWWVAIYTAASELVPWRMPMSAATLLLAVVAGDFCYYLEHRCAHRFSLLWAAYHAVHHSSPGYTVATAYRVSFVNQFIAPAFYLPCIVLGTPPLLVVGLQVLSIHYQAWVHTEMVGPLGVLDNVFNTPANHRMHHDEESSRDAVNLGGILILWDRLFGTYAPVREVRHYGLSGSVPPGSVLSVYSLPLAEALRGRATTARSRMARVPTAPRRLFKRTIRRFLGRLSLFISGRIRHIPACPQVRRQNVVAELRSVIVRRSTSMTAACRSSFDTSSWVSLRWERGTRYYRTHLEQDLWGHWTLTRVAGRKGAPRGRYMTSWVSSLQDGLTTLGAIAKHRRERGYRLVS